MRTAPAIFTLDRRLSHWMHRHGHRIHRLTLAGLFIWLGLLKQAGLPTTTSLLAHVIYWSTPEVMIPLLGWWEVAIGLCLLVHPLARLGLLLLGLRMVGTAGALITLPHVTFVHVPWAPTPEGQFLIKDLVIFGAAFVIGGTVRRSDSRRWHP